MQKNMFLSIAAVAALTLLSGCGSKEEVKPLEQEQDMAAAAVQENVQVAENAEAPEAVTPAAEEVAEEVAAPAEENEENKA